MTASSIWFDHGNRIRLGVTRHAALPAAKAHLVSVLADVALAADADLPDADVARANRAAGSYATVSAPGLALIDCALELALASDGAFDPTRSGRWSEVRLDHAMRRVRVPGRARLDLTGVAMPWAADRAAHMIASTLSTGVLVQIGDHVASAGVLPQPWFVVTSLGRRTGNRPTLLERGGLSSSVMRDGRVAQVRSDSAVRAAAACALVLRDDVTAVQDWPGTSAQVRDARGHVTGTDQMSHTVTA